jgi:hypothetical protein
MWRQRWNDAARSSSGHPSELEEPRKDSLLEPPERDNPDGFCISCLYHCERIGFCSFKATDFMVICYGRLRKLKYTEKHSVVVKSICSVARIPSLILTTSY